MQYEKIETSTKLRFGHTLGEHKASPLQKLMDMKLKGLLFAILFGFSALVANAQLSEYDANAPLGFGANTTGGAGGTSVTVSTLSELQSALKSSGKKEIYIKGAIQLTSMLRVDRQSNKTLYGLPGSSLYSNERTNASNTGILYFKNCSNIIIRNVTFKSAGAYDCDGNDNLCFENCQNMWVDHCDFQDGVDGNFDCKKQSDNICVSWCKFHYLKAPMSGGSGGASDHRFTNLWGSDDKYTDDRGKLRTTFVCCWWGEGCKERMPRVRYGQVHIVNCLWNSSVTNYCVAAGQEAQVYVEKSAFIGVKNPITDYDNSNQSGGVMVDCYTQNISGSTSVRYCTFNPSNAYANNWKKIDANQVLTVLTGCNGAGATLNVEEGKGVVGSACGGGSHGGGDQDPIKNDPVITKTGSGPSKQTIELGESIVNFGYTWSYADDVEVNGLPSGINVNIDRSSKKVSISGTPTEFGVFNYTIQTVGAENNAQKSGCITVTKNGFTGNASLIICDENAQIQDSVILGNAITPFCFAFSNCQSIEIQGLPNGIETNISNDTLFVSGTPTEIGNYSWNAKTVGGISETTITGQINVINDPTSTKDISHESIFVQNVIDDRLNIWIANETDVKIEIITLTGQVEESIEHTSGDISVDCSNLNKGVYIVRITTSDNVIAKKMVKR